MTTVGRDYLGSNFIKVYPENAKNPGTDLGTDYLGSKFVAKISQNNDEHNSVLGKDYLGSNFISFQHSKENHQRSEITAESNYVIGKDYLGSNFVSHQSSQTNASHQKDRETVLGTDFLGSTFITNNKKLTSNQTAIKILNDSAKPKEETLDVLGNGLLVKKILHFGDGISTRPERGQEITIQLEVQLKSGKVIEPQKEVKFILADRDVPDAIDLAVNLMELHEHASLTSDSKFAYGEKGKDPNIPANTDLVFIITLLAIEEGPYNTSVDVGKRIQWADKKREMGNDLFSEQRYLEATQAYSKCAKVLEQAMVQHHEDIISDQIKQLTVKCCNNLIASNMKLEMWADALKACKAVLSIDPINTKALFRKGKILSETGDLKKAVQTLQQALKSNPDNKHISNEVSRLTKKLSLQNKARKEMYQKMLGNKDKEEKDDRHERSSSSSTSLMIGGALVAIGAILLGVYMSHR